MEKKKPAWFINVCTLIVTLLPVYPIVFSLLYLALLLTPLYPWSLLHLSWTIYDIQTAYKGGRRSEWVRNMRLWKYASQYFPFQLVKTAELDPGHNYVIGYHPHGKFGTGAFIGFTTEAANFGKLFPEITPHLMVLDYWFWISVAREFLMALGMCASSRGSINYILNKKGKGNAVVVIVGGEREMWATQPYTMKLKLKNRKGFVRMAVKNGAHLVPVISFGDNEMFPPTIDKRLTWVYDTCFRYWFYGWGSFKFLIPRMPNKIPVTIIVGKPIEVVRDENASEEVIDKYHQQYIQSLQQLFDEYKTKVGDEYKDMELVLF